MHRAAVTSRNWNSLNYECRYHHKQHPNTPEIVGLFEIKQLLNKSTYFTSLKFTDTDINVF